MKLLVFCVLLVVVLTDTVVLSLTFKNAYTSVNTTVGSNVTLPCEVVPVSNHAYYIEWYDSQGNHLTNVTEQIPPYQRYHVIHSSDHVWDLFITNTQTWDSGEFWCQANDWSHAAVNLTVSYNDTNDFGAADSVDTTTSTLSTTTVETTSTLSTTAVDPCSPNPCKNNGTCTHQSRLRCDCITGDPNNNCSLNEEDECYKTLPSGADYIACIDYIGRSDLICAPGYTNDVSGCRGSEDPQNYCKRYKCQNDGYCKPYCNVDVCNGTENCAFTANPFGTPVFGNQTDCISSFADGYYNSNCNTEPFLYNGFNRLFSTISDCSPYFNTICTEDFGNNKCNPVCNNTDCLNDGFDCLSDRTTEELPGVIVLELKGWSDPIPINKSFSMMMRSKVNGMIEDELCIDNQRCVMSLRVDNTTFSSIVYAGQFLAAMIGKRAGWYDDYTQVKDVYVCDAGMYSETYEDKCSKKCTTCIQEGDVCDWKTGICLHGCPPKNWGDRCTPCDTCIDQGDVCDSTGRCLYGCRPGHWGTHCDKCSIYCNQTGGVCHNDTGVCVDGCVEGFFYGPTCTPCPRSCDADCNEFGHCTSCAVGIFGDICEKGCDGFCIGACNQATGACTCGDHRYWNDGPQRCEACADGCIDDTCDGRTGSCDCKSGYQGNTCVDTCSRACVQKTCDVNGVCDQGCIGGFYGPTCTKSCPTNCLSCSVDGNCQGKCKPGFAGSSCEMRQDAVANTDHTGVIVGLIIGIVLIVIIIGVACCYWRHRQSGDFVIEDEENEVPEKNTNNVVVSASSGLQPSSPLIGKSTDMIDMDEVNQTVVYAGPSADTQTAPVDAADGDHQKAEETPPSVERPTSDSSSIPEEGGKGRCTSSIVIEVGNNGRLLSISDGDETQSPSAISGGPGIETIEDVENEPPEDDDNAFVEEPPQSPLSDSKAPLASEEDLLASLGPKTADFSESDTPADIVIEVEQDKPDSKRSSKRSSSSSSSASSKSSKSSKSNKSDSDSEKTTEM